jgi:hypothetical protein
MIEIIKLKIVRNSISPIKINENASKLKYTNKCTSKSIDAYIKNPPSVNVLIEGIAVVLYPSLGSMILRT